MSMFTDQVRNQLKGVLREMKDKVKIHFFSQEFECNACKSTHEFLDEFAELSDHLELIIYEFKKDEEKAGKYNVDKIPAIVLTRENEKNTGVRYFGPPGGYEINSFLKGILAVSGEKEQLPEAVLSQIVNIRDKIHIQVFVTLGCPYCPAAVESAHRIALENENVTADMIEASTFPHLALKYEVQGVPKIVINEKEELTGAQPVENILEAIKKL